MPSPPSTPATFKARCKAAVQELRPTPCWAPTNSAKAVSNALTFGPRPHQPERRTSVTASISSSPTEGLKTGITSIPVDCGAPTYLLVWSAARGFGLGSGDALLVKIKELTCQSGPCESLGNKDSSVPCQSLSLGIVAEHPFDRLRDGFWPQLGGEYCVRGSQLWRERGLVAKNDWSTTGHRL